MSPIYCGSKGMALGVVPIIRHRKNHFVSTPRSGCVLLSSTPAYFCWIEIESSLERNSSGVYKAYRPKSGQRTTDIMLLVGIPVVEHAHILIFVHQHEEFMRSMAWIGVWLKVSASKFDVLKTVWNGDPLGAPNWAFLGTRNSFAEMVGCEHL